MVIEAKGCCPYCGQEQVMRCDDFMTQPEIDRLAGDNCTCEGAAEARFERRLDTALEGVLGKNAEKAGFDYVMDDEVVSFARIIGNRIHSGKVNNVTFVEQKGDTIKLSRNGQSVKVTRICKKQVQM